MHEEANAKVVGMNSRDRRSAGEKAGPPASSEPKETPAALCEIGACHMRAKRHLEAMTFCKRALAIDPSFADALHLMGLLFLETNQLDHAVEWIAQAIRQDPKAEYLSSLGSALLRQGRKDEALKALDKAVQLKPDDARLWEGLGVALEEAARSSEALLCFQHALKFDPRSADAAYHAALLLRQFGRLEEALEHFNLRHELRPGEALILGMKSLVLRDLHRFEEYFSAAREAHLLAPTSAELRNNVGDACLLLDRFDDALQWFESALKIHPSFILALENKGTTLNNLHRFEEVFPVYDQIKAIDPTHANAEFCAANVNLLLGNFEAGWKQREARWRVPGLPIRLLDVPEPIWLGEESIQEKTVLIHADEGFGDAIQFTRSVPMLAERGARVVLVVHDELVPLLSAIPGLSSCLPKSTASLPLADFWCPAMSLPLAFGTMLDTIPPPIRLAPALDQTRTWEQRLGARDRLRVGLAWSGSHTHPNDHARSIRLELLASLLGMKVDFVSLQKDPRPHDKRFLETTGIIDLTDHLGDFSETAALISCLDLVITVDTSIAHLAGALGHPTWILLPHLPDYRWMLNRQDSPWYPTVRLFRKEGPGGYEGVIQHIRAELARMIF
jgi:tetratricopeptide (TPR) repeat protein